MGPSSYSLGGSIDAKSPGWSISGNVQQVAAGTQQVNDNIAGINQGVGETGQVTQEVMSAANVLATHSDSLRKEVDKFLQTVRAA